MHANEVDTDVSLVERLLAAQFPQWANLPIEPVESGGTDNALYRLGDDMVVRLPRRERTSATLEKERRWLPRLAPLLPLAVPLPLAEGMPAEGYPYEWSVYWWLEGENATVASIADPSRLATDLAQFVAALQRIDPTGGPPPGEHNFFRGVSLEMRDESTGAAITSLRDTIDVGAVTVAWEAALRAPEWRRAPLERQLPAKTRGEGVVESAFDHYQPVSGTIPTRQRSDHNPLNREEYLLHVARRVTRR